MYRSVRQTPPTLSSPPPLRSDPKVKYYFYCGQWLDRDHGVEKRLHVSFTDPRANMPVYTITTHTSNIKNAGTDAKVCVGGL